MDIRFKHKDVCAAMREYMERRGMEAPTEDSGFVLLSEKEGVFVVEVTDVNVTGKVSAALPQSTRQSVAASFESTLAEIAAEHEGDETSDAMPQVDEENASDFDAVATESQIESLFKQAGKKAKPAKAASNDFRPNHERFRSTTRYRSLEAAGKEDGDIADEIT